MDDEPRTDEPAVPPDPPPSSTAGDPTPWTPSAPIAETALAPPEPPRRRFPRLWLVAVLLLVLLAGGAAAAFMLLKGSPDTIEAMVPSDAAVYVTAFLDPSASQKANLFRLSRKFPDLANPDQMNQGVDEFLDSMLAGAGLTAKDVRPWLGSQVAVALRFSGDSPSVAVLIDSKDDQGARSALQKVRNGPGGGASTWTVRSHGGVDVNVGTQSGQPDMVYAMIGHTVVLANDAAFVEEVVDTGQGRHGTLSSTSRFADTMANLPGSRLGLAYVDVAALLPQIRAALAGSGLDLTKLDTGFGQIDAISGFGITLSAEPNGVALQGAVAIDPSKLASDDPGAGADHENAVLAYVPQKAFAVVAASGFRDGARSLLDQASTGAGADFDQLDQAIGLSAAIDNLTGDGGLEIGAGTAGPYPSGALLLGVDNPAEFRAFLGTLGDFVVRQASGGAPLPPGTGWTGETYRGSDIASLSIPPGIETFGVTPAYAVVGNVAVIASSPAEVKAVIDAKRTGATIQAAPAFREAIGTDRPGGNLVFVDIETVAATIRSVLPPADRERFDSEVAPNLAPVKAMVATAHSTRTATTFREFVLIK